MNVLCEGQGLMRSFFPSRSIASCIVFLILGFIGQLDYVIDTVAEWLRRQTRIIPPPRTKKIRTSVFFGSAGSNPAGVDVFL